jgi:iron complex transport system permease protein
MEEDCAVYGSGINDETHVLDVCTRKHVWLIVLVCILVITSALSLIMGSYHISALDAYSVILVHLNPFSSAAQGGLIIDKVVWDLRLPRIIVAVLVGISLSMSGTVFQSVFRNPLVEPYILGVSSGAAFGAACGIVFPTLFISVQFSAFVFGALAVIGAYALSRIHGETPVVTLILAGVVIGSVFSSFVSILKYIASDTALRDIVFWLMGGFYYSSWNEIIHFVPIVIVGMAVLLRLGWTLNILSMGDEEARCLGVNPERYKFIVVSIATMLTAYAVSIVGIIAWVGLMMPHAARLMFGPDNRYVIPASALMGAIYLIICDTLARTVTSAEVPVGIIVSLIGAPYLCYLLRNKGRSVYG